MFVVDVVVSERNKQHRANNLNISISGFDSGLGYSTLFGQNKKNSIRMMLEEKISSMVITDTVLSGKSFQKRTLIQI